jgi:hypothetical protein
MLVCYGKSGRNLTNQTLNFVGRIRNFLYLSAVFSSFCAQIVLNFVQNGSLLKQLIHDIKVCDSAFVLGPHWPTSIRTI